MAMGVFWSVWGHYGIMWGVCYGLLWPVWVGYRMAEIFLG